MNDINLLDLNKVYTYADYLKWTFEERVELIKGKIFKMSPAPSSHHQVISSELQGIIWYFLRNKSCRVFDAPFDVRLYNKKRSEEANAPIFTVVQPDLCVVCDLSKVDKRGCLGAPDFVIEILSQGNSAKEMNEKYDAYQEAGVREYWLVDYFSRVTFVYLLQDDKFFGLKPFTENTPIPVNTLPGLVIDMKKIYKRLDFLNK